MTALVSVFLTPFILRQMGDPCYGVWAALGSVYAYSMVLQLGLYSAINLHIPMYLARNQPDKVREVVSTTTAFFLLLGLLLLVFTLICGQRVLALFVIPDDLQVPARLALYSVGLVASVCLSLNSFGAVLSGYQRYELIAAGRLLALGLRVGLVVALLGRGETLLTMALIFGATEGLIGIMNLALGWRLLPSRPLKLKAIRWKVLQEMFAYGMNTFIYAIGAIAVAKSGEIIVGAYLPPEHITYYSLALMPPMLLAGFVEASVASIKPAVTDLHNRHDPQRIRELTLVSQKYVLLFLVTAMAFFLILGGDLYRVWLHRSLSQAETLLPILAAGYLVHAALYPLFLVLAGLGEHRIFGLLTFVMGLAAIGLELFFCRVMGWGTIGVAVGSTLAMVIICGVVLPLHAAKRLHIPLAEFVHRSWMPTALGVAPAILVLGMWKVWWEPDTLLGLAAVALSTGVVLLGSTWYFALQQHERNRFCAMARSVLQNLGAIPWVGKLVRGWAL